MTEQEYTPTTDTTDEIRADFAGFPHRCNDCQHMDEAARFDRWLAARDREVAARAWDEGAQHVYAEGRCLFAQDGDPCPANPYRAAVQEGN